MNLAFTGSDTVSNLYIDGVRKLAGTWGATGSGATYIDDTHFQGTGVLNVTSGPTSTTTVASSLNPSTYGQSVTFTATVTGTNASFSPTGTVTFMDGATTLGTGTLSGSPTATTTLTTSALLAAAHSITAVYGGDTNFAGSTSSVLTQTVKPGAMAKLQLLMPGESAAPGTPSGKTGTPNAQTAGTGYTVTVNAVDANWNVVSTNDTIQITTTDANATLPANAALVAGTKTFNITNKTAGTFTVTASDVTHTGMTANTSPSFTVNPAAFTKLQILVPGQSAAPGTASGLTGSATAQTTDTPLTVTVNAVDANWNLINTASDTIAITSTDPNATLPANAALSSGTQTFSVKFNTAGTRTITASDASNGGITAMTSSNITVSVGAFAKLQLLLPGETAAAGTTLGKTGSPTGQTAGTGYSVTVNAVDAAWNLVNTVTHTVGLTSSDTAATLPVNTALVAGTKSLSVTNKTEGLESLTATDITDGTKTANLNAVVVGPAAATKLVLATQPSSTATAGVPFAQQPVIYIEDTYGNIRSNDTLTVTALRTSTSGAGTLLGTTNMAAVGGVATYTNLAHGYATNITITFTNSGLTAATSGTISVSPAAYSQLLVLLPGQTNAPATTTGWTGSATPQTAGTPFTVKVSAVDAYWNLVNTVTDLTGITSSDTTATLPANAALINGTNSFSITLKDAGTQTVTATDVTTGTQTGTSSSLTVNPGAATKLQLLMLGEAAAPGTSSGKTGTPNAQTAGTGYTVTVNAVDANWNVVSTNDTIQITTTDANATLPANAALVAGTKTFNITNKTAGTFTVTASDVTHTGMTANTSPSFTVNPAAFTKLQILVPGQSAAPGTASGLTGSATAQTTDTPLTVTVNAVDANWNLINTASDTIAITSTDPNATLPANAALSSGTQTFSVKFNTAGTRTITASDASNGGITAMTSSNITVSVGAFAKLQLLLPGETAAAGTTLGKTGSPTGQTAGTGYSVTVNAVDAAWNLVNTVTHTVGLTSSDTAATLPVNTALVAGTKSLSVTNKTEGLESLTATDITDGTKTANLNAVVVGPAAATKLVLATQPSSTATAGVPFAQQPVIYIEDTYGNIRSNDTLTVTALRTSTSGAGTLLGTTNMAAVGGVATYTNLAHGYATNITITFTNSGLTAATSGTISVSPAAYSQLLVLLPGQTNAPATTTGWTGSATPQTAGTPFTVKVSAVDAYWNLVNTVTDLTGITSSDTTATLPANAALINGTNSFSITLKDAGTQTVTATDVTTGTQTGTSSSLTVNPGAATKLQLLMLGEAAAPGTSSGKTGTPNAQTAGTGYTVTVNAVDANWNVVSNTHTINITTTDPNDVLPANAALVAGTKTFSLTNKTAGTWTVTASDNSGSPLTNNTGSSYTVNPNTFTKLQVVMPGETASPGSSTGKTGAASTQTAGASLTVTVNAVDANWNVVPSVTDTVAIASSDANAILPANAALSSGTQAFGFTFNTAGTSTVTASDVTTSGITTNQGTATTVIAAPLDHYSVAVSSPNNTGVPFTTTVTARDAFNNPVTNDTATVTLTGTGSVQFDANADDVYGDNTKALAAGVLTINAKDDIAETISITATDTAGKTGTLSGIAVTPASGAFRTAQSGNWNSTSTWQTNNGTSWVAATSPPTSASGVITIQSGHTVTVTANVTNDQVVVLSGGQITVNSGVTLTIANGTGTDLDIFGTVNVLGTMTINASGDVVVESGGVLANAGTITTTGTLTFESGGTYQHNFTTTAGTIPTATWNPGSTCQVLGYTTDTTAPSGLGQPFQNLTWNCPSQTGGITLTGFTNANGTFSLSSSGSGSVTLAANAVIGTTANISSGATLNCGTYVISGAAFNLASGATLGVGSTAGITASGATGNIQTTARSFDPGANYIYNGTSAQVTGSGLPGTVNGLTVTNSGGLTLSASETISGDLNIQSGTLTLGSFTADRASAGGTLTVASGAGLSIGGTGTLPANYTTHSIGSTSTITYGGTTQTIATLNSSQNYGSLTLSGSGSSKTLAGSIGVSGTCTVGSGVTLLVTNATTFNILGTLTITSPGIVQVNSGGILENSGTITSTASTLTFASGATYQHNFTTTAGTIPTATWSTNSTCEVIGYTSNTTAPSGLGQTFGHFTWNCSNQGANFGSVAGGLTNVLGNFNVVTGNLYWGNSGSFGTLTMNVGGDVNIQGGAFWWMNTGSGTFTLNLAGNYNQTGGTFLDNSSSGILTVNFTGAGKTFTQSGGTLNTTNINFSVSSGASLTLNNNLTENASRTFTVNSGATLNCGTNVINGAGTFTLASGGTLGVGSAAGITAAGATGNIQTTTRSFSTGANYVFNGSVAQATGAGLPGTNNNLTINNAAGVSLSSSTLVNGTLALSSGLLSTPSTQVNLATNATISGAGSTSYINGSLLKAFVAGNNQAFTFPIGNPSTYAPISLTSLSVTTAGGLLARTVSGEHPNIATSGLDSSRDITRYWTLTNSPAGIVVSACTATFNFAPGDVDASATTSSFVLRRFNGSWNTGTLASQTATSATATGVTAFGDFAIGDQAIDHYLVSASTPQSVTAVFSTTVTARDTLNQTVPDSSTSVTMTGTGSVEFDSNGDGTFGDNTKTLSNGTFSINTRDAAGELITITATDGNARTGTSSAITVNKLSQTISFGTLSSRTYGDAGFALSATASSGLPVSFSIVSGPASLNGSTVTPTGAGTATVRASQAGDATYLAATNVDQSFTVNRAALTVTADNQIKAYGATSPTSRPATAGS